MRILFTALTISLALILVQVGASDADSGGVENELLSAAFRGKSEEVKKSLAKGADPNSADDIGQTALMGAARNGHVETVILLLAAGARPDVKLHATKWTALLLAAFYGHAGVVKALLDHGADPTVKDSEGKTALTWAKVKRHAKVIAVFEEARVRE